MKKRQNKKVLLSSCSKFKISNKKGIELSINFLVLFILALVMFTIGLIFVYEIFTKLIFFSNNIEDQIKDEIINRLPQSGIGISSENIKRGDLTIFFLGIRNDLDTNQSFFVHSHCDHAIKKDNSIICDPDSGISCNQFNSLITFNPIGPINIESNEIHFEDIPVNIPKNIQKGTYVFYVKVCKDNPCTIKYKNTLTMNLVIK
jgi:hypothetical protein